MKSACFESVARYLLPLRGGGVFCGLLVLAITAPAGAGLSGLAAAAVAAVPAAADLDESPLTWDEAVPLVDPAALQFPDLIASVDFSRSAAGLAPQVSGLEPDAPGVAYELPPPPGGAQIVLSFLLPLGAWGAIRSARSANLASLPEWYHVTAPERVNHSAVFELDFPQMTLHWVATLVDTSAASVQPFTAFPRGRDVPRAGVSQHIRRLASPRAPPTHGQSGLDRV